MWLVLLLFVALALYGFQEYYRHHLVLKKIPVRIHINGTRGKSSVTRLIGGGLKGGGKRVFIKTTGTKPRTIDTSGNEKPIYRVGKPNIIEQLKIARQAASEKAEFLVVECMAVQPDLQWLAEHKMIKSQVGVITNVRDDHLDVMGPTMDDAAEALSSTIPRRGTLFTTEKTRLEILRKKAMSLGSEIKYIDPSAVDLADLKGFSYLEHRENVALALAVCGHFGVNRQAALKGMQQISPDPGVLRKYILSLDGKTIEFVNAFAANDPDSYRAIWNMLDIHRTPDKKLIVLVNSRKDRIQRAEQLGEFIAKDLEADFFVISGEYTHALTHRAIHCGLSPNRIKDLGGKPAEQVFQYIVSITPKESMVVGIGNIVGLGEEIVNHFVSSGRMSA